MHKKIILVLLPFFATAVFAQESQVSVKSKINQVTVFMNGAQVERSSDLVEVPQGTSLLVFSGLSSNIETQSLQAKGDGNFTILSVTKQNNFLIAKKKSEEKDALQDKSVSIADKMTAIRNEIAVYKAEEEMLTKNQTVMGPNINYDLAKLKTALDFQRQRLKEVKSKQASLDKQLQQLQQDFGKINSQVVEVDGKAIGNSNDVVVKVSAKSATKGKFTLTYLVNNANWYPTYDIRAKDVSSPIELIYKANVSQNSGEDWKNVKLILSSGNPSNNNEKPSLSPYQLGYLSAGYSFFNPASAALSVAKGKVVSANDNLPLEGVSVRAKNTSVATITDASGNFSLQMPAGSNVLEFNYVGFERQELPVSFSNLMVRLRESQQMLQEVMISRTAGSSAKADTKLILRGNSAMSSVPLEVKNTEQQTNVTFEIKLPYTILSDGKQATVEIGNYDFKADYEYYAIPKITPSAFLTAKIANFNEANLMSGEASIFFEGTYLGKSLLDVQLTDTLTLSLGVDKNVTVKREKQKGYNERQFLGSSQKDSRHFVIDVRNRKSQAINITIEDQLPISTNGDISVDRQELSKAKLDETTGKLTWQFLLQPNQQQRIDLKYQVKYPKNKPINIE